jgi:hypothetical protein
VAGPSAQQLASSLSGGSLSELRKRIFFVIGALIVFRIGTFIPIPGIDINVMREIFEQQRTGILGMFNMFSGGALERMSIFALGVMPYISASIIMQLLTVAGNLPGDWYLDCIVRTKWRRRCGAGRKPGTVFHFYRGGYPGHRHYVPDVAR